MSEHRHGRIRNPYVGSGTYNCFGCSPDNPSGLQLSFYVDGDTVYAPWHPVRAFEGYPGVVHGGIQATLCDETGAWFLHGVLGTAGVTRDLNVRYLTPAKSEDAPFRIEASLAERSGRHVTVSVSIKGASGTEFTTANIVYVVFPEDVATKKFGFPGAAAFEIEESSGQQ